MTGTDVGKAVYSAMVSLFAVFTILWVVNLAYGGNYGSNENNGGQTSSRMGDRESLTTTGGGGRFGYSPVGNAASVGRGGWGYGRSYNTVGPGGLLGGGV